MDNFAAALAAVRKLKEDGVVTEYAIGGAMAHAFWSEPTATFDLDVFVVFRSEGLPASLGPIYEWARANGYVPEAEHIDVAGVPVQVIPAHNGLTEEAVKDAAELNYEGMPVRVMRPEHLIAMSLDGSARSAKRLARVQILLESAQVDWTVLADLLARYELRLPSDFE